MPHPTPPDDIARREAIRRVALLLGGAVSAPAMLGVLAGCGADDGRGAAADPAWAPRALTAPQVEQVATIAEHILPATDTPGARAAGVHRFVDTMLAEYYAPDVRARFVAGLADVDARARRAHGRDFLRCDADAQRALVATLDREAFASAPPAPRPDPSRETQRGVAAARSGGLPPDTARRAQPAPAQPPFFRVLKELTLLGYYTSEVGVTRELRWVQVPGRFEGCVPLVRTGRAPTV